MLTSALWLDKCMWRLILIHVYEITSMDIYVNFEKWHVMWEFMSWYASNLIIVVIVEWSSLCNKRFLYDWYDESVMIWFRVKMRWWNVVNSFRCILPLYIWNRWRPYMYMILHSFLCVDWSILCRLDRKEWR